MTATVDALDEIVSDSLTAFVADVLHSGWRGKEHDWVNRYAHAYLLPCCTPTGPLREASQLGIEVGVPQPPGYEKGATRRDLVIWPSGRYSCWRADWKPVYHPIALFEWKVHRVGRPKSEQPHEREWLRRYSAWQAGPVAYAVEIDLLPSASTLTCTRFHAGTELLNWRSF